MAKRLKKLTRALQVAQTLPDLAATAETMPRLQLYAALAKAGYRWDTSDLVWRKVREARA